MRRPAPSLLLAGCLLLLAGCATLRTLPPPDLQPAHRITVFNDGFHSGVMLDKAALPPGFDPRSGDLPAQWPMLTVHFGEQLWTDGEDTSILHALRLVVVPGRGVVQSDHTRADLQDVPGVEFAHLRTWTFAVNQEGIDRLVAVLQQRWLDGRIMERQEGEASNLYPSPLSWSVFHSCHDFTVAMLRAAGLDLRGRWLYLAGGLATDLDDASRELRVAGIRVIGVAPDPAPVSR